MAGLAQSVEHQIVALRAMGSSPIARPNFQDRIEKGAISKYEIAPF